jgi:SnoaL-like domain
MSAQTRYWDLLLARDEKGVRELFTADPIIDDPLHGRVKGPEAVSSFVSGHGQWLADQGARVTVLKTFGDEERSVSELVLDLECDSGPVSFPVAIVEEGSAEKGLDAIRVYHSTWPLNKTHTVRSPLIPERRELRPTGILAAYLEALDAGDVERVVDAFEDASYFREPSGGSFQFEGKQALREVYERNFSGGGGVHLQIGSLTVDDTLTALEFICDRWGSAPMPPQAGIGIYELGPAGRLAGTRIYDDIQGPV